MTQKNNNNNDGKNVYRERANFNSYLINTGMSLAYGVLGGEIILWLKDHSTDIFTPVALGLGLMLLNTIFIWIAYYKYSVSNTKKTRR